MNNIVSAKELNPPSRAQEYPSSGLRLDGIGKGLKEPRRIPIPQCISLADRRPDLLDFLLTELDMDRPDILLQVLDVLGSRDGDDIIALGQEPGKSKLAGGASWVE